MDRRRLAASNPTTRRLLWSLLCITLLGAMPSAAWSQGNSAVVAGTQRVFVRRGPGTEFPAFTTLAKGSPVDILEMQGEWARVKIANGQVGYVHSNFLQLSSEAGSHAEAPRTAPAAQPAAQGADAALSGLTEKNRALEAQVSALQEELTALKSRAAEAPAPGPTAAAGGDAEDLRGELQHLTAAVEALQKQVAGTSASNAAPPSGALPPEATEHAVPSTALVLGAVGLLVGWLAGAAYGRNQERGRRSRIRF
jgi:SH3 domain protein